jgi:hypothetical protein
LLDGTVVGLVTSEAQKVSGNIPRLVAVDIPLRRFSLPRQTGPTGQAAAPSGCQLGQLGE